MIDTITGQFVIMGVSGSGKSSVAEGLALRTGGLFLDADDFHPPSNRGKMAAGIPLTDDDRWPWIDVLNAELNRQMTDQRTVFLACSALKQVYRDRLSAGLPLLRFIYLKGSKSLLQQRLSGRQHHFMPAALLDSQLATLEEPANAITVSIADPVPMIVDTLVATLLAMKNAQTKIY